MLVVIGRSSGDGLGRSGGGVGRDQPEVGTYPKVAAGTGRSGWWVKAKPGEGKGERTRRVTGALGGLNRTVLFQPLINVFTTHQRLKCNMLCACVALALLSDVLLHDGQRAWPILGSYANKPSKACRPH